MFCNHTSVNQLTALLPAHGVTDVVVCPGSRNGAIVHNLHELRDRIRLFPVTDERCAAFTALGISQHTRRPVAVCVTSGSALLNTLPAVAESYFQHIPLLVVSADRPEAIIGQLDGQTLQQQNALQPYCRTWQLAEGQNEADRMLNRRRINEALRSLHHHGGQPAHINVPLAPPLFEFTTKQLPEERPVTDATAPNERPIPADLMQHVADAKALPLLVLGQLPEGCGEAVRKLDRNNAALVLPEITSNVPFCHRTNRFAAENTLPEKAFALHLGGNFIGKKLKEMLRGSHHIEVFRFGEEAEEPDTFGHLTAIVRCAPLTALRQLVEELPVGNAQVKAWKAKLDREDICEKEDEAMFDEAAAVRTIVRRIEGEPLIGALHLANSMAVRLTQRFFRHAPLFPICCNRGVNGIEGSVSAAAGYALSSAKSTDGEPVRPTLLLTGDLSFHYDSNALWNDSLGGNLRIVVLNNGGGRIFRTLPGLSDSPARDPYIAGGNTSSARGICESHRVNYLEAHCLEELRTALGTLLTADSTRPVLLEVFIP